MKESAQRPIPRSLQLARAIHARFTDQEQQERAMWEAAEALAAQKNALIMHAITEVVEFSECLCGLPALAASLSKKTDRITQSLFSSRADYAISDHLIDVRYEIPVYVVDMQVPGHIRPYIKAKVAYLHIHFNPVTFMIINPDPDGAICITKSLLMKQYHLKLLEDVLQFHTHDGIVADPIADMITELRLKLGHAFFETHLIPYLESKATLSEPQ